MNLIRRNIDIFDEQYPRLKKYAKNAEACIDSEEYNLCMIYLGRIAETITRILCRRCNIPCDNDEPGLVQKLLEREQITQNISRKINAMMELHNDASNDGYNSGTSCRRMYEAAVQLCEWFISVQRFDFLKNLMLPEMPSDKKYPFSKLAKLGRDAENNIYPLTRYGLLCVGSMGEEVCMCLTYKFINMITAEKVRGFIELEDANGRDINLRTIAGELSNESPDVRRIAHRVRKLEQALRIKFLFHCGIIGEEQKNILKRMLEPRNGAVHGEIEINGDIITYYTRRHDRQTLNAKKLLDDTQTLCAWLFRRFISPGCIIRGRVESTGQNNMRVSSGPVYGFVRRGDIPEGHECITGNIYPFDVLSIEGNRINLGMQWMILAERYRRYHNGQEVRASVVSIEEGHGVNVEIKEEGYTEGLGAFIALSETGDMNLSEGQEINAKVNGFSIGRPYMFLTMKDVEQENQVSNAENISGLSTETENNEPVIEPADEPASEPVAVEVTQPEPEPVDEPASEPAPVEVTQPEPVVEPEPAAVEVTQPEPAIEPEPEHIEVTQPEPAIKPEPEPEPVDEPAIKPEPADEPVPEPEAITEEERKELQRNFLRLCMSGTEEEISRAISAGVNINVRNRSQATALMFAAQNNTANVIELLIDAGLDIDSQDIHGNTALIYAASYNNDDVVYMLITKGAEVNIMNHTGRKALIFAKKNYRLNDTEALRVLEEQTRD